MWADGFPFEGDVGAVEVGYGLAPSARGHGYAAEALIARPAVAAEHGVLRVVADTTLDNVASQRTLLRAGFHLVGTDAGFPHYEVSVGRGIDGQPWSVDRRDDPVGRAATGRAPPFVRLLRTVPADCRR